MFKTLNHGRMSAMSDTLTISLVLVLLFGSIALYLYTRIQQAEQKINLLENILLDLKTSSEIKSYMELPAESGEIDTGVIEAEPAPFRSSTSPVEVLDEEDIAPGCTVKCDSPITNSSYKPFDNDDDDLETTGNVRGTVISDEDDNSSTPIATYTDSSKMTVNYEAMTLKELQSIAKQRGITGAGSMKKGPIIEALKTSDRISTNELIEPGSLSGNGSFVESSSILAQE